MAISHLSLGAGAVDCEWDGQAFKLIFEFVRSRNFAFSHPHVHWMIGLAGTNQARSGPVVTKISLEGLIRHTLHKYQLLSVLSVLLVRNMSFQLRDAVRQRISTADPCRIPFGSLT